MEPQPEVQRIGRYEVVRKIATGGMAELFLARYLGPGGFEKRCALKRILPQLAADQAFTRMFLTEAKVTAQLDHPNIVQIFELGQDDNGQYFIAMEMVNGLNLRQLLTMAKEQRRAIPPELAAHIATQALEGLAYAHALHNGAGQPLNLVHRDISPQNILVSYEGAVKLVDFGIVKGSTISGETQTGMLKGKVAYMSPEQATGEPIDARADLFSLSVVLFELIAGERPFTANNELMMLKAICETPPRMLTDFAPECPEGIERAILQGLAKYPQERFSSARTYHRALDHVLRECPVPLGRHVVAEFIQSLTEGSTVSFDATRLKIPRRAPVGFGYHLGPGLDPHRPWTGLAEAAATAAGPVPGVESLAVPPAFAAEVEAALLPSPSGAPPAPSSPALVAPQTASLVGDSTPPSGSGRWNRPATFSGADLDSADLAAAGVGTPRWLAPMAVVLTLALIWVGIYIWQRSDVDAVIVSPDRPPRVERVDDPPALALPQKRLSAQKQTAAPAILTPTKNEPPVRDGLPSKATKTNPIQNSPRPTKARHAEPQNARPRPTKARHAEPQNARPRPTKAVQATRANSPPRPAKPSQPVSSEGVPPAAPTPSGRAEVVQPGGQLILQSVPAGLVVRNNGKRLGTTPLTAALPPGEHPLLLRSRKRGISRRVTVSVQDGQTTETRVVFKKGTVQVVSRPWAEVFLDGQSRGNTPVTLTAYEGTHVLKLVSSDGAERIQSIKLEPGANPLIRVIF